MTTTKTISQLFIAALALGAFTHIYADESVALSATQTLADAAQGKAEQKISLQGQSGYYLESRSYGTLRETEPPRYVKQANKTWLKDYGWEDVNWLDIGLDYRVRYEYRDNDYRRSRDTLDEPILLRTRGFIAIKDILDPLRFTLEVEDARRNNGQFTREYDTRDVNKAEPIQAYAELYFKEALGKDDLGNARPVSIKAGRHAFEYLDRRLLARNEWRNTTNTFQGVRAQLGQKHNDWQVDVLALQPITRFTDQLDQRERGQALYGVIGDWRRWSDIVTLQPYYLYFRQDGDKVEYDANGRSLAGNARIDRDIHTAGLRAYGVVGKTGWDYDINYQTQWGEQQRKNNAGVVTGELDHQAYAYNIEAGYTLEHLWNPRFSANYGFASGDKDPNDLKNQRFERLYGFSRPWSNNDHIQMENIEALKLRIETMPRPDLRVDYTASKYRLASATDRWASTNLRDTSGDSGQDIGNEFDVRVRYAVSPRVQAHVGYVYFWAGDFAKNTAQQIEPERSADNQFLYAEILVSLF